MARNLVNLKDAAKGYGARTVLRDVTLGVAAGDRIGIVGRNGDGKSTLLRLIAGVEEPDAGAVTRVGGLHVALLGQVDDLVGCARSATSSSAAARTTSGRRTRAFAPCSTGCWAAWRCAGSRAGLDTPIAPLSGGERRRIALARTLLGHPELLLLDEPTNHLDVEGVDWLARHLAERRGSMLVVTHDRWFLDAVCTHTWEVSDGSVHQYEGGYAAYVLARAERERQAAAREERRQQLLRKELAWLRRGPPARTSKPKFRIEAANALIADEPEPRDRAELLRFATARLGDEGRRRRGSLALVRRRRALLRDVTWRLGPGDRFALVGVNGSGKTSLTRLLAGELEPTAGVVSRGATVRLARLSQDTAEIRAGPAGARGASRRSAATGGSATGGSSPPSSLLERFGFRGERARAFVRDLSGGERRRLQLMRLLMGEPNVLLLDEPTNDLDIDTLTALEDLLDGWPGTLVVVSHDRYFVERVCDDVYALVGDGSLRHLPGGIEQYLDVAAPGSEPVACAGCAAGADAGGRAGRAQGSGTARARHRKACR